MPPEDDGMVLRKVRPGLYERIDTPKDVRISREFLEAVRRHTKSEVLAEIVEEAIREQETGRRNGKKQS